MLLTRLFCCLALTTVLAACASTGSSRYSCGVPVGQPCRSALDVYADTNGDVSTVTSRERGDQDVASVDLWQVDQRADGELVLVAEAGPSLPTVPSSMPVRTEARILRIWIAPFENADGDLVAGAHLYTEIEPRRWRYGQTALAEAPSLSLLPDSAPEPTATTKAAAADPP